MAKHSSPQAAFAAAQSILAAQAAADLREEVLGYMALRGEYSLVAHVPALVHLCLTARSEANVYASEEKMTPAVAAVVEALTAEGVLVPGLVDIDGRLVEGCLVPTEDRQPLHTCIGRDSLGCAYAAQCPLPSRVYWHIPVFSPLGRVEAEHAAVRRALAAQR